jgi:hypothetical protein
MRSGLTTKVSHAADNVNRNSGTESVIGVGSGDWLGHNIVIILLLVQTLWLLCEKQKNAAAKHDRHQDIINDTILCGRMAHQSNHGEQTNHNSKKLVHGGCHNG